MIGLRSRMQCRGCCGACNHTESGQKLLHGLKLDALRIWCSFILPAVRDEENLVDYAMATKGVGEHDGDSFETVVVTKSLHPWQRRLRPRYHCGGREEVELLHDLGKRRILSPSCRHLARMGGGGQTILSVIAALLDTS